MHEGSLSEGMGSTQALHISGEMCRGTEHDDATFYNTYYYNIYIGSIVLDMPELILSNIALYFQPFIDDDPDFIFKYRY